MKRIELYQLAFYLPYNVEFTNNIPLGKTTQKFKLTPRHLIGSDWSKNKLILKSISDITKGEINELFEMFGDLCRIGNQLHFNEFLKEHFENLDTLPLRICQELAKRGYDIFNLLENNLAINFYSY